MQDSESFPFRADIQFDSIAPNKPERRQRVLKRVVDPGSFYRDVKRELPDCPFTRAKRFALGEHKVLERWRLEADRAGDRMGLDVGKSIVKTNVMRKFAEAQPKKARATTAAWQVDEMPPMNGLWKNRGTTKDSAGRLYVNCECTGPCCSGPVVPARTRKFPAGEWMRRQTSCAGCATFRRRQNGEVAKPKEDADRLKAMREKYAVWKLNRICTVCRHPLGDETRAVHLACRLKANESSRRLRKEDTRRAPEQLELV